MSHVNLQGQEARGLNLMSGIKFGTITWVPADNAALDEDSPFWNIMTPAGAVDVLMPASTEARKGLAFLITNNNGVGAVTLKTSADAVFDPSIVIGDGETTLVACTGSAVAADGWKAISTATSA